MKKIGSPENTGTGGGRKKHVPTATAKAATTEKLGEDIALAAYSNNFSTVCTLKNGMLLTNCPGYAKL